jgi:hypothetical protein
MVPFEGFENAAIKLAASNRMMFNRTDRPLKLAAAAPTDDAEDQADNGDDEEAEGDKLTHEFANYGPGEPGSQCQDCAHYTVDGDTAHCAIVVDPIAPEDTCDKFVDADGEAGGEGDAPMTIAASISIPTTPPRAWFELAEPRPGEPFLDGLGDDVLVEQRQPRYERNRVIGFGDEVLGMACPLEITDDGRVYGHLTYWGQCHIGNPWGAGQCAAPSPSEDEYSEFHASGYVRCDDGSELRVGLLHVGCEHSTAMDVRGVRDAAAHAGLAFAQVRVIDGQYGPWMCGSLLPTVTEEQVVKLRALTLSGEWVPELGAVIAVNNGGLPLQRVDRIAASSGAVFPVANRVLRANMSDGVTTKLVGGNAIYRCPDCQKRAAAAARAPMTEAAIAARLATIEQQLDRVITTQDAIESRTRHLIGPEAEAIRAALAARTERES